jgi:hypothetical protein
LRAQLGGANGGRPPRRATRGSKILIHPPLDNHICFREKRRIGFRRSRRPPLSPAELRAQRRAKIEPRPLFLGNQECPH